MAANSEQHYSLRWNDYTVKICTAFQALRDEEDFVDVTVACDGHHYSAHKMVLSACSPYFRSLLRANPCQHPIVILKDVGHTEMERLLEFMYNGEVNIAQDQLAAFLKTAESLRIRGLAGSSEEIDQSQNREISQNSYSSITNNTCGNNLNTNSRGSPCGVNFSQEKDDDITSDVFHINSPPAKRRKRSSGTSLIANTENSTSHNTDSLTGDNMLSGPPDPTIEMEDPTLHPDSVREFKSEPCDALQDVYAETDELTHQQHHNDAMPGPSGSLMSNQEDGLATNGLLDSSMSEGDSNFLSFGNFTSPSSTWGQQQTSSKSTNSNSSTSTDNQCLVCYKSFSNRGSMTRHLRDQHLQPGATVTCDICGKICKNRNCLITHRSVAHSGRKKVRSYSRTSLDLATDGISAEAEAAIHQIMAGRTTDNSVDLKVEAAQAALHQIISLQESSLI